MAANRTSPLLKNPDWPDGAAPAGWASMDLKEVVLREEHLRLTAQARIETACCTEHALASQLSEMKAAAKSSLAKAANWKDEALRHLSKIEKHRREEVRDLLEAETILRRQMQDAEDSSDKCLAELRSEHAHAERRVAREFEEFDAALLVRSKAAEELLAAAEKEKSLTRMCALHGLRGEALEARLHVSRQLMVEACQAHEAADRREAVAALARSEARGAEELAVQQAASQGLMESQFLRQSAAERAEQLEEQEATVKARADKAVALVEGEVEALRHGALQCSVSEQAEEFIELARQGLARKSTILEKAEAAVADAWKSEEANIRAMREEQNVEVQEALESAAAAAAIGEELATELGEELRTRLRGVRSEEKQMQHECEKAIEAVQGKGTCQEEEDMHRLRSTECSESELLAERLHIEEEVLSFEVTEEEAASMLRQQLEQQINEAAEQCKELAKNTSGALQQLRELTQQAEQSTRQAEEAAEQDEKMHRCAAQQSETSAEAAEKLQQRRSLALHEEVLAAKLNAERSIAHDEWLAGEEEEAALAEEDRCIRACCEEIAAARYEAETVISSWRVEDAVLEVDAQELLDKAAELQVESRMLEESRCSEEETCEELVVAADEVRAAARAAVHGYEAREAIAQRTAHELQEEAKQKQEARSLHAGHRFNSAELRAEAAARRALEAEESSWIARQRYEQELASMRVHGEKEEAETIRRVLAAEEALANSMRWSGQHNQLGLELFGVAQAQKGIRRSSPASVANGAPPDSAEVG